MKTFWIVALVIIGLGIYFNIGYWVGEYFYLHTQVQKPDTFWAKFLIGGGSSSMVFQKITTRKLWFFLPCRGPSD
ncbi:MAG: hypothetical protein AAB631_02885 [Patescibacteria group bacterium]